jgi:hypothetical protein
MQDMIEQCERNKQSVVGVPMYFAIDPDGRCALYPLPLNPCSVKVFYDVHQPQLPVKHDLLFHERTYPEVDTNIRFEQNTESFGLVRLQYHPEGIALWVGGECRWRSWLDPALWNVRP